MNVATDRDGGGPSPTPAAATAPALSVQGISVHFGGILALRGVSFEVPPGSIRGLIGPNGAGKTTLFDVISGIRQPDEGSVLLSGDNVTAQSPVRRARRGLRRTFQRVQVFGRLSVADNLLVALEYHGGGGGLLADFLALPARKRLERERRLRVAEVAELCGLTYVLDRPAGSLPFGLARQVELGRALVDLPSVLLLDEPTSGLDEAETRRLGDLIRTLSAEHSCAIVLVEHNVQFVMDHCGQITFLSLGRVLAEGTPEEIRADPDVRAVYLG
ncbi:MAG: ABC transporter ATP-binding protein [Actinobacteria bacterium]|nr:ABC transporter ATP-binding protein [Actinomycetota bacterium]